MDVLFYIMLSRRVAGPLDASGDGTAWRAGGLVGRGSRLPLVLGNGQDVRHQLPDCSWREHEGAPGIETLASRSRSTTDTTDAYFELGEVPCLGLR
jgi:hypothetical protein